jgi:hypothetical protein
MPLLLPNLDDRTWADLVDEGRSLIPVYGPEWTDHNASDPGITLIELLAWFAEMDIYELNQISDRERLKFLKLVGVTPQPPLAARSIVRIELLAGNPPLKLAAGIEFLGVDLTGSSPSVVPRYRTRKELMLVSGTIEALQSRSGTVFQNLTSAWKRRSPIAPFSTTPQPGTEFYIGLSEAIPPDTSAQIFFTFTGAQSGEAERCRIMHEASVREKACRPPGNPCAKGTSRKPCGGKSATLTQSALPPEIPLKHYGVRTVWEFLSATAPRFQWTSLDPAKGEVEDNTRAFTLNGAVVFRLPAAMAAGALGAISESRYYLRCRFVAGSYDAAPVLQDIALNGVPVEQAVPSGMSFVIDPAAKITYAASGQPKPNDVTRLTMTLDDKQRIVELTFGSDVETDPAFLVYDYKEPCDGAAGLLSFEGVFLGFGTGLPDQQLTFKDAPVERSSLLLFTLEEDHWRRWELVPDFDASTRRDFHALLDPTSGILTFSDGEKGRVLPQILSSGKPRRQKCLAFAQYRTTRAEGGNLPVGLITQLADDPHNRALLYDKTVVPHGYPRPDGWAKVKSQLKSITNSTPAAGGTPAETSALATSRADILVESSDRAVTLADYERLALQAPGTRVARATAIANLHPSFPCFKAPGMITVIVLPFLPKSRPLPSPGLLQAVGTYLRRRRVIGTRIEVVPPTYLDVSIQADVQALAGANKSQLRVAIVTALNRFLDPLVGGPDGSGWPFGRDIYRSEIMRVMNEVPGVDYIASLSLITDNGQPQCGNICLAPTWLVAAGTHQITIV